VVLVIHVSFVGGLGYKERMIRPARADDLPALVDLEIAASQPFRDVGLDVVADDDPWTTAELSVFADDGRAWVLTDDGDRPVAYVLVDVVDGEAHIEQVSVHPDHARRGLGRQLIDVAREWAVRHELPALVLTTYAGVPWNGPYYARLGFEVVPRRRVSAGMRAIRAAEAARGLDKMPRVVMRQRLASGS
jgi:ribosomal protein S18 acetylase RimI-like enzyme